MTEREEARDKIARDGRDADRSECLKIFDLSVRFSLSNFL